MSFTYCNRCAAKIEYILTKPTRCPKCNKDIIYAAPALSISIPPPPAHAATKQVVSPLYRARHLVRPSNLKGGDGQPDETTAQDIYDSNEVEILKDQLLSSIDPDSFIKVETAQKLTLGDIMNNPSSADRY